MDTAPGTVPCFRRRPLILSRRPSGTARPLMGSRKTGHRQLPAGTALVLTLGYSRKSVQLLVPSVQRAGLGRAVQTAFRRLGATVRVVVLDNLNEGVLKPEIYVPTLIPLYRDVLAHCDVVALTHVPRPR